MSAQQQYGQRRVLVTPEFIEDMLVRGCSLKTSLPDDARFLRMYPSEEAEGYFFVFESWEWEEKKEAEKVPRIDVRVEQPNWKVEVKK